MGIRNKKKKPPILYLVDQEGKKDDKVAIKEDCFREKCIRLVEVRLMLESGRLFR